MVFEPLPEQVVTVAGHGGHQLDGSEVATLLGGESSDRSCYAEHTGKWSHWLVVLL